MPAVTSCPCPVVLLLLLLSSSESGSEQERWASDRPRGSGIGWGVSSFAKRLWGIAPVLWGWGEERCCVDYGGRGGEAGCGCGGGRGEFGRIIQVGVAG